MPNDAYASRLDDAEELRGVPFHEHIVADLDGIFPGYRGESVDLPRWKAGEDRMRLERLRMGSGRHRRHHSMGRVRSPRWGSRSPAENPPPHGSPCPSCQVAESTMPARGTPIAPQRR